MLITRESAETQSGPRVHPSFAPKRRDLLLTTVFIAFFLLQLYHHQLWRDELNAWGLARSSSSLAQLVANAHLEGHTVFWYLLLWLPSRFVQSPATVKLVEAFVGTSIYLVIGLRSPFSSVEKLLVFSSYFVVFEYTVMSRPYGLCLLAVLIYLSHRYRRSEMHIEAAIWLGVLTMIDTLGLTLSFALAAEYVWSQWQRRKSRPLSLPSSRAAVAFVLYSLLVVFSIWSAKPSPHASHTGKLGQHAFDVTHLAVSITNAVVLPWLPLQHGFIHHYWGEVDVQLQLIVLVPIVLFAYYLLFHRQPNLLALVLLATGEAIAFDHLVYESSIRHLGFTFIAFLAALWLQRCSQPRMPDLGRFMLGVSVISGILISLLVWTRPFSNAGASAKWLRTQPFQDAVLVGTPDFSGASLAIELNRPVYFLECECSDRYMVFSDRRDGFNWDTIPERLARARDTMPGKDMILAISVPLTQKYARELLDRQVQVSKIAEFSGSAVTFEDYYFYRVQKVASRGKSGNGD